MKKVVRALTLLVAVFSMVVTFTSNLAIAKDAKYTTQYPAYTLDGKTVLGRLEHIYFTGSGKYSDIPFVGKIDTGADTTSMHADDILIYSLNPTYKALTNRELLKKVIIDFGGVESDWWRKAFNDAEHENLQVRVSFTIRNPISGEVLEFDRPLYRISVVRSRTSKEPLYRPVIDLKMKIADVDIHTEASLTDRSKFSAPILIGKSFLKQHAWVFAGYDFLQEQPKAQLVGRQETLMVGDLAMETSFSLTSRHSVMHATNINVDKQNNMVSFTTEDAQGKSESLTLPLIDTLTFGKTERPEVYIAVKGKNGFETHLLVYLKDRSKNSTQLRIGTDVLSKNFVLSANEKHLLDKPAEMFSDRMKQKRPLVISPEEELLIDGVEVKSEIDLNVQTPLLTLPSFELSGANKGQQVTYYLQDRHGKLKKQVKAVERKIKVGNSVRPIVEMRIEANGQYKDYQVALDSLENEGDQQVTFHIGRGMGKNGLLINTRTDLLLESHQLIKAGYIENATVEGMTFPVKLDTGADMSSIHAQDITLYEQDGKKMVDFTYRNSQGQKQTFTRDIVRMMTIKAKSGEKANHRPVVKMDVQVGDIRETVNVNLQDRSRFEYSMILGENFLRHGVVVSSDSTFLLE